jgi:hypothetical protein
VDELNGSMLACQILVTGLVAEVASSRSDPIGFLSACRDEVKAVIAGVTLAGLDDSRAVRTIALRTADEMFSLMKPPSSDVE